MRLSPRSIAAIVAASAMFAASTSEAFPVTVDGDPSEWLARAATGDNFGIIARGNAGQGSYVWRDVAGDTRTDVSMPETIADLTRVQTTASAAGLSFFVTLNAPNAHTAMQPVQVQIAIDTDQVSGSGQTFFAGFADMVVPESARWERLIQTQFTAGTTARVFDASFAVTGSFSVGVTSSASATQIEFTVPWAMLGLTAPPATPLRLSIATFRERAGGDTVDVGGSSVPNALDVVSDYNVPATSTTRNTFDEFSTAGDNRLDYSVDLYFNNAGEVYAPLLVTRYVSYATNDATNGGEWIMLRNMTPGPLQLGSYRLGDEETAGSTEGMRTLPTVTLAAGATFVAAENGTNYLARYGVRPDGEWNAADPMVPDLTAYTAWTTGNIALANAGDEILVLDRSHTAIDIVVFGTGSYSGVTTMTAPASNAAASRNSSTFADTDNCATDFTTSTALCANDSQCGGCGTCVLNVCVSRAAGFVCRASAGVCDVAESCDGTSLACPADTFAPATTVCRASAGVCDVAETCTGSSAECPVDSFAPSTTVCRASVGDCDVAETCTGSSAACPTDAVASMLVVCRPSAGDCDVAETCDGISRSCPTDFLAPSTTVCRASAGDCDVAETCTGSSAACPANTFAPATTVCRASAGVCDVAETCTGSSAACPADALASATTVCRASAGACDVAETCDGSSVTCPADALAPATTVCRASTGVCDVAETCTGSSVACPTDSFAPATTVCRASTGVCDVAETCTGSSAACPANTFAPATTVCRASAGDCDVAETCTGSSDACPTDSFAPATTVCRASAGVCDVAETCTGSSATCPANTFAPATTVCRASAGACDLAETCTGSSATCPTDVLASSTTVCRVSTGPCDVAETCDGMNTSCPADGFASAGTSCADSDRCNGDETCDGAGVCTSGAPVVCAPSGDPCRSNTCVSSTGLCALSNVMAGVSCSDGDFCNGEETCDGLGACVMGAPPADAGALCADAGDASADAADGAIDDVTDAASDGPSDTVEPDATADAEADANATDASADAAEDVTTDVSGDDAVVSDGSLIDAQEDVSSDAQADARADARDAMSDGSSDVGAENDMLSGGGCGCRTAPGSTAPSGAPWAMVAIGAALSLAASRRAARARRAS